MVFLGVSHKNHFVAFCYTNVIYKTGQCFINHIGIRVSSILLVNTECENSVAGMDVSGFVFCLDANSDS